MDREDNKCFYDKFQYNQWKYKCDPNTCQKLKCIHGVKKDSLYAQTYTHTQRRTRTDTH